MHLHSENMKTLALRRDATSHTSYKLFIFPLCCRAGSCSELCCHHIAAGLFEILDDAVHFHVAHLSAVIEWWRMGGGDRGFKRQISALLQTTGTCKGPPKHHDCSKVSISHPELAFLSNLWPTELPLTAGKLVPLDGGYRYMHVDTCV